MSIVEELQTEALDDTTTVSSLVRRALVAARKLDVADFAEWAANELYGYDDDEDLPNYRYVAGQLRAIDNWTGQLQRVNVQSEVLINQLGRLPVSMALASIEEIAAADGEYVIPNVDMEFTIHGQGRTQAQSAVAVQTRQYSKILDSVRNVLLEWALTLENEGIVGENMSFTPEERQKAHDSPTVSIGHIGTVTGNIGLVSNSTTYAAGGDLQTHADSLSQLADQIIQQADNMGLSDKETTEVKNAADELRESSTQVPMDKSRVRSALDSIKQLAINAGGNLTAQGVLAMIANFGA